MKAICKHKAELFKRLLSMMLVFVIICGNFDAGGIARAAAEEGNPTVAAEPADLQSTLIDFAGYRSKPLDIYNHLYYSNANGEVTPSGGSYEIRGTNTDDNSQLIVIGNHPVDTDHRKNSTDYNILVSLAGLIMSKSVTIKPCGTDNSHKVVLTVSGESSLGALVVEDSAIVELILNTNLTVDSITLGNNSTLTVSGNGTLTVKGGFVSQGTVALNGGIILANNGISTVNLSLNGTTVKANSDKIVSTKTLSMQDSTVENASVFGYEAVGADPDMHVLTLSGNNVFSDVTAVGCAQNSAVRASIEGIDTVSSSSSTTYFCDYTITYLAGSETINPEDDWPVAYRVSSGTAGFDNATICGYHSGTGYTPVTDGKFPLQNYAKPGYIGQGWKLNGSENPVSEITATGGNLTLSAVMKADAVSLNFDRGYEPNIYTNDKDADGNLPGKIINDVAELDKKVSLPVPTRFGYKFKGWHITSGTNQRDILYEEGKSLSYTVTLADCTSYEESHIVTMTALWEEDKFYITLFLGSSVTEASNISISVDGGITFKKFTELESDNIDIIGRAIQFKNHQITYGQNISNYLRNFFPKLPEGTLPILKDNSAAGTAQTFAGWSNASGSINGTTCFLYGENGMLAPSNKTLTEYQKDLHTNSAPVNATWGTMHYYLTLPTMPDGWTLTYIGSDDEEHVIREGAAAGRIEVQQGGAVTLTTIAKAPENFSLWGFTNNEGTQIFPQEQPYKDGDSNLTYKFTMPAADVTATYGKGNEIWIDIACSPIMFEENVMYHDRGRSGFWYADLIDGMTPLFQSNDKVLPGTDIDRRPLTVKAYFYQWDFADKFCVTSNGKATQNQLTLVNALTGGVYLKDVNLEMRDAYVSKTIKSLIDGVDCESSQDDNRLTAQMVEDGLKDVKLSDYANIVINNSTWQAYTTILNFIGTNNTVGAIMQDKLRVSSNNLNSLTLKGNVMDSSAVAVKLGAAFGNFDYTVSYITVTEYTKPEPENDFKYLFYCANQTGCIVKNAVITAPHKNIHAGCMTNTSKSISLTDSTVELYSICVFRSFNVSNSYLRVHENVRLGILPVYLEKNAKVVIDGNMEMNYHHWADSDASESKGGATDNSPGNWLVVKGTFCDISNRSWKAGTLICNTLVLGRTGGIKGGTVITNQIINQAVGFWEYDPTNHTYGYDERGNRQTRRAESNNDDYPFTVYHHSAEGPNTYTFSGGKIYLLGYYKTKQKTITEDNNIITITAYDDTVKAMSDGNPVKQFITPLFDEKGDLVDDPSVKLNLTDVENAVKESSLKNNECIVLGNSSNYYSTRRSVEISGGEIYAAGNITFYNNTTVSGGTIYCNGSFGSKGDVTVIDGSITATAVGNAYNLKTTLEDGTFRWKRTDIRGGTITAKRIGAFEKSVSNTAEPKGTVTIGTGATIVGTTEITNPVIIHDVYINYIFDAKLFSNNGIPANQNTIRFKTTWKQGTAFANQAWSNTALIFTAPEILGGTTGETANWNWDSLTGSTVTGISVAGIVETTGSPKAYDRIQMRLYAVKLNYNLIFKAGASQITDITSDGTSVTVPSTDGGKASVKARGSVVLTFNDSTMAQDKTVIWYIDGSNIIHSVNPIVNGNTISFTMPNSDVEVYVASEIYLDLDIASYTLLQDGFRTEANATPVRTDSTFHYLGNLVIHQGCITKNIEFDIDMSNGKSEQIISPGNDKQTINKILVDKDFKNTASGSRTVTLCRIYQNGTPTSYGIDLEVGAKAHFLLDGAIRICRVRVPYGSDFILKGKNNARTKDAIYPFYNGDALKGDDWASIGNFRDAAGNITLQDLTILGKQQGMQGSLCYSGKESSNTVTYKNCVYKSSQSGKDSYGWYNRNCFANNAGTVIFDGCEITLKISRDWPGTFCSDCTKVEIKNGSKITVTDSGSNQTDPTRSFFFKIKDSLLIDNATLELSLREPDDGKTYRVYLGASSLPKKIELTNKAKLVLEQHALLNKLVIGGTSTVRVGKTGTGYLLCGDVEVNGNATLEAGGIIVSGYYNGVGELQTESQFLKAMAEGKHIFNGKNYPGLVVNGGKVTASKYITGDVNGKITINGGVVTAPKIGTTGYLYGYTQYVPKANEKYVYTYKRIPVGMTISINGGEVNVSDFLGGMHAAVTVSGGTVSLGESAVLGLTEDQQTTLYNHATENNRTPTDFGSLTVSGGKVEGAMNAESTKGGSIQVPYGTVDISGADTGINVYDLTAYCGRVTISGTTGKIYNNRYDANDRLPGHDKLAVYVVNQLSAKNLTITAGSVVYAGFAYANVPKNETGDITVTVAGNDRAYLYVGNAHGVIGEGNGTHAYNDGLPGLEGVQNVFGIKVVYVHYIIQPADVFLPGDIGREDNPNMDPQNGLPYYVVSTDPNDIYTLKDASCKGYKFLGWYEYDPDTKTLGKDIVTQISKTNSKELYLGAKWEKVKVTFEIRITLTDTNKSEFNQDTMVAVDEGAGLYKFKQQATVLYGDKLLSSEGVYLANYSTNTWGLLEVAYHEKNIQDTDIVTVEMVEEFVNGNSSPVVLTVTPNGTFTERILITFNQNKNNERPKDTAFNLNEGTLDGGGNKSDYVSVYELVTGKLGDIAPFAKVEEGGDGLINPTATGYTFDGWYTDKECTNKVNSNTAIKELYKNSTTVIYAKWTPNTYMVQFNVAMIGETSYTDNRWVTEDKIAPAVGAPVVQTMNYYWIYDTSTKENGKFWVSSGANKEYKADLPCAWREGYIFEGWYIDGHDGVITGENQLNKFVIEELQADNYVGSGIDTPALILHASYRQVVVSYDLNGGKWKDGISPSSNPAYGKALAGYTKTVNSDGTTSYSVISTTSEQFSSSSGKYVPGDYRETLSRKGYTFVGWKNATGGDAYYGCTPRFDDISLKAEWSANTYSLKLHVKDGNYSNYESEFSASSEVTINSITVGQPISASDVWPKKADWYAYNTGETSTDENKLRYMLGVTFAALDPGKSNTDNGEPSATYLSYAKAVTNMFNGKTMFDNGDIFCLPDDKEYLEDLTGAEVTVSTMYKVPDYPNGSVIPMYGVYRERSLVFIEEYVDSDGHTQSKVMYSCPWNSYSDYPFIKYPEDVEGRHKELTKSGYALVGWYVGSSHIDSTLEYPEKKEEFEKKIGSWKEQSTHNNYDINVYTAYVAQQEISHLLQASTESAETSQPSRADYTLPGSMQEGKLSYSLIGFPEGLHLVTKDEMQEHQYDSSWITDGKTYTANDTVAIRLTLEKDATSHTVDLKENDIPEGWNSITKGWKITLTLYHSKVMTDTKKFSFVVQYNFENLDENKVNQLADQWLKDTITVNLVPSLYEVEYKVNLPEDKDQLMILDANGFSEITNENAYHYTDSLSYNSVLLAANKTMQLEGYSREAAWYYVTGDNKKVSLDNLTLQLTDIREAERKTELSDGRITINVGYEAMIYTLNKENFPTNETWNITYGNGADDTGYPTALETTTADVKYHSLVTFTLESNQPVEYITLVLTDGTTNETVRLDRYEHVTKQGTTFTFVMPAKNITVKYIDVMVLYLDNGTIELSPDGFKQSKYGNTPVSWPGDYRILQCDGDNADFHSTENVLKLSGDLTQRKDRKDTVRKISLGNLNISSDNSIELIKDGTNVTNVSLTQEGKIQAKNILVPAGTSLTVMGQNYPYGPDQSHPISLVPSSDRAAIGATQTDAANGSITLNGVDISMTLSAPSVSSGIGSGNQESNSTTPYGKVVITDSLITVVETSNPSAQYTGAWVGGARVQSVSISDTSIVDGNGSNHYAKAVDGIEVNLSKCYVGDSMNPVKEPIHAAEELNITECNIHLQNNYDLNNLSMIGTDGGTTTVSKSTVQVGYGVLGETDKLFTGKLLISDAKSDITIDGTQVVEVGNGAITIKETGVTQPDPDVEHLHDGLNYLLLNESTASTAPDLTVIGLGENKTITVQQFDSNKTVTIGKLSIQDDAKLILNGNLTVNGTTDITANNTLTVMGGSYGVTYRDKLSGAGSYVQTGGNLTGLDDVVVGGNMTLTDVTANCGGHSLGSNGGSSTTASTVTVSGGSITADTIGACGAQNATFTFVKLENNPTLVGKLVQDHYRISYEVGNAKLNTDALPTVLRTETYAGTVTVCDEIPEKPIGNDAERFKCWYIWNKDGTERLGLTTGDLPVGLTTGTSLSGATDSIKMGETAKDGTQTLSVYAWMAVTGTAQIKSGRLFMSFTDAGNTVSISGRGVWTVMLEVNGSHITGRDYQVTFDKALPVGTDLTLTVITSTGKTYYHYTLTSNKGSIKFSEFTKMGTTADVPPVLTDGDEGIEVFLLSADFGELTGTDAPIGGVVTFSMILTDGTANLLNVNTVNYTVTAVTNGVIAADNSKVVNVQTPPSGEEKRKDKTVYLVGTLMKDGQPLKVPFDTSASLSTTAGAKISGRWISGDTVVFELGSYGDLTATDYSFTFEGLPASEYSIEWRLCTGDVPNLTNNVCSNNATSAMTVEAKTQPKLAVTYDNPSRVLSKDDLRLTFTYVTTASDFTVTVEKQTILATWDTVPTATVTVNEASPSGTVVVVIPAAPGTYRVRFSMAEGSSNDDVYFTFIVK